MLKFLMLISFVILTFLFYCIYIVIFYKRLLVQERLKTNVLTQENYEEVDINKKTELPIRKRIYGLIVKILPYRKYILKKKKKLAQVNVLMKPEEFFGISVLAGIMVSLLTYSIIGHWLIAITGFLLGFLFPNCILNQMKNKRGKKLNSQLPEALNIISNGIRAGYSFSQSMYSAAKELHPPIADEFNKIIRDNSLGKPMEEALLAAIERTEDEDMDMFVTALIIQRQVGGNLSEILDTISNTIRERVRVRGEIRTLTAQGKLSAIIISLLPVFILVAIMMLNPDYMNTLFTHPIGIFMLFTAAIMDITGIILLRKIVNINI